MWLSVLWGGSFFFNAVALTGLPVLTVVLCRVGLAAAVLLVACQVAGARVPTRPAVLGAFLCMGLLNNVLPFGLIVWGQLQVAPGLSSILNATTPLFTVMVAHLVTRDEKLTRGRVAGVVLGMVGVGAIVGPATLAGIGSGVPGQMAVLAGALPYAVAGVFGRRSAAWASHRWRPRRGRSAPRH